MAHTKVGEWLRLRKRLSWEVGVLAALLGQQVHGGALEGFKTLLSNKLEYTIAVTDSKGRPLDGATVWVLANDVSRQDLTPDDLARLVRRYSADADYVFTNRLHANLIVLHTTDTGKAKLHFDKRDFGTLDALTLNFAAIKRGFLPAVQSSVAKLHSNRSLTFALDSDGKSATSPLLEEFDHLRALGDKLLESGMSEQTAAELSKLQTQIREIAVKLEAQGNAEGAAAVYYNLAYFPAVDWQPDAGGAIALKGYSRGFDPQSPTRVADRARAWDLNKTHPWLEFEHMREREVARGLMVFVGQKNSESRRAFITQTERLIREYPDRMWPDAFTLLWRAYNAEGNFAAGCGTLQRYYAFEPSSFDNANWWSLLDLYAADVRMRGGVPNCVIAQLPSRVSHH